MPSPSPCDAVAPADRDTASTLADLLAAALRDAEDAITVVGWAADEIKRAAVRHRYHCDLLHHAFVLLQPRQLGAGAFEQFVYRSHAAELLDRVAAGQDTRPATAAEISLACHAISLRVPIHGVAFGLYARMWCQAFADHPLTAPIADTRAHYERLHGERIDDLERHLRARLADPRRILGAVRCTGVHHGRRVDCRFTIGGARAC